MKKDGDGEGVNIVRTSVLRYRKTIALGFSTSSGSHGDLIGMWDVCLSHIFF